MPRARFPEPVLAQVAIAVRVGASREMIGKLLKDLVAGGDLTIDERTITVRRVLRCAW